MGDSTAGHGIPSQIPKVFHAWKGDAPVAVPAVGRRGGKPPLQPLNRCLRQAAPVREVAVCAAQSFQLIQEAGHVRRSGFKPVHIQPRHRAMKRFDQRGDERMADLIVGNDVRPLHTGQRQQQRCDDAGAVFAGSAVKEHRPFNFSDAGEKRSETCLPMMQQGGIEFTHIAGVRHRSANLIQQRQFQQGKSCAPGQGAWLLAALKTAAQIDHKGEPHPLQRGDSLF